MAEPSVKIPSQTTRQDEQRIEEISSAYSKAQHSSVLPLVFRNAAEVNLALAVLHLQDSFNIKARATVAQNRHYIVIAPKTRDDRTAIKQKVGLLKQSLFVPKAQ